ncbi:MAG: Jag N-terminal domain-containing protein [Desulfobacula sp.]|uniref:RNA-binding cell elongation regulator Jag/EloR n=1 Tax=Desulfobacula sp. TaxID=2593537 RepID=UPI0025BA5136|nr:RNA-binding cell elongation regulator Jag/EloR [Desulfobacula sp.]MCD4722523.1 Jag N-terminal domain-containing protein [Desulfobacula sp.]
MEQTQEFSGKDVDIAIKNACVALTLSKDELEYKIISEGASGIFGIVGRRDAKIKVVLPDNDIASETELEGIKSIVDEAFGEETRLEEPKKEESKKEESPIKEVKSFEAPEPVDVSEDSIALGSEALQRMADLITDDAKVSAQTQTDRLTLSIEGGNTGILIGRKGQTLDAMQFLTDKIINRKSEARVRVKVDIEGYMETRKSNLRHLAYKMADKAKKTGRPATINQMSAQDRRIVHLALKDDNKVRTQSMGDGYYRRLVIFPKKKNSFRGKRRLRR